MVADIIITILQSTVTTQHRTATTNNYNGIHMPPKIGFAYRYSTTVHPKCIAHTSKVNNGHGVFLPVFWHHLVVGLYVPKYSTVFSIY